MKTLNRRLTAPGSYTHLYVYKRQVAWQRLDVGVEKHQQPPCPAVETGYADWTNDFLSGESRTGKQGLLCRRGVQPRWERRSDPIGESRMTETAGRYCSAKAALEARKRQEGGAHYLNMGVRPWDAMKAWLSEEQYTGYLLGSAIGYMARFNAVAPGKGCLLYTSRCV